MADRDHPSWISPEPVRRAKSAVAVALSLVILVGVIGVASWKGYSFYMDLMQHDDYIGDGDEPLQFVIPGGLGIGWGVVGDNLVAKDVIKDASLFEKAALAIDTDNQGPTPGTWKIFTHLPAKTAAEMLTDKTNLVTVTLTVPEGRRLDNLYQILIDNVGVTQDQIDQAMAANAADPGANIFGLNPDANGNPEGYLFPDTYILYPPLNTDVMSIFKLMAARFTDVATDIGLDDGAAALGLTPQQVVVVASIIEAEVNGDADRAKVARAIYNRLAIDMPLRVESAFRYGRLMADGTPYDDDITVDSQNDASLPYNYYINPGIPASPIDSPGREALEAALNPADGDWLYWVTVNLNTGETKFATTEGEFNELVDEFQQWCSDNGQPKGCS